MTPEEVISFQLSQYTTNREAEEMTKDILAALKAAGRVVVPVEPTEDICKAAARATGDAPHHSYWKTIYRAMIRAATGRE